MAAHEHLNPKLFHSSSHLFKKGELVKPGVAGAVALGGVLHEPHAYATSDFIIAKGIAESAAWVFSKSKANGGGLAGLNGRCAAGYYQPSYGSGSCRQCKRARFGR